MKKKLGRPKLKAKERKEIYPVRLSALELTVLKKAAGQQPLSTWMRETLLSAAGMDEHTKAGIRALVDEATGVATKSRPASSVPPPSSPARTPTGQPSR